MAQYNAIWKEKKKKGCNFYEMYVNVNYPDGNSMSIFNKKC